MTTEKDLKYDDLVSPTMTPDEYFKTYGEKSENNYKSYEPKSKTLEKIKESLKRKNQKLKIVALGADWCPDCSRNVPRMIKITENLETDDIDLKILYGIMVNAMRKPDEVIWHKTRSPPEAINPKFALKAIPTFYFFDRKNELLGVIIEGPQPSSTLEEELLEILEKKS